ncbi:MAG: cytochrome b/b6 domain-containing protein [Reyranellaceae bacterium]
MSDRAEAGYTGIARLFHWSTAVVVLLMLAIGIVMANLDLGPAQGMLYHLHRSLGVALLPLVLARLLYRMRHPPPPLPASVSPGQRRIARLTHWALYGLLLLQALVGWIATSAYRAPILVFWLVELPPIWPEDRPFSESLFAVHRVLGLALLGLIALHVGAALFHHFVLKDDVIRRMVRG